MEQDVDAHVKHIQSTDRFAIGLVSIAPFLIVPFILFFFNDIAQLFLAQEFLYGRIKGAAGLVTIGTLGLNAYLGWLVKIDLNNLNNALYLLKEAKNNTEEKK